jgi:hypothetical protein
VPTTQVAQPLPSSLDGSQVPERILQKEDAMVGTAVRLQGLIQWSGFPSSLTTLEDMESLREQYPRAPAWGKLDLIRRRLSVVMCVQELKKVKQVTPTRMDKLKTTKLESWRWAVSRRWDHWPHTCVHGPQWK